MSNKVVNCGNGNSSETDPNGHTIVRNSYGNIVFEYQSRDGQISELDYLPGVRFTNPRLTVINCQLVGLTSRQNVDSSHGIGENDERQQATIERSRAEDSRSKHPEKLPVTDYASSRIRASEEPPPHPTN